jgi:hypothetical protein
MSKRTQSGARLSYRDWPAAAGVALIVAAMVLAVVPSARAEGDRGSLAFAELYRTQSVLGLELSAKATSLAGKPVQILGYMAPPLKAEMGFFVLTRAPVALCPFCNSDADWPTDIVVVYPRTGPPLAHDGLPVAVSGVLELGSKTDPRTGFVSLVRIVDANVKELR